MNLLTACITGLIFALGLFQLLRRSILRGAIGLVIISNAVNLFLLSAGAYDGIRLPYTTSSGGVRADALPQAMILTAIVISMGSFAVVLALLHRISTRHRTADIRSCVELRN